VRKNGHFNFAQSGHYNFALTPGIRHYRPNVMNQDRSFQLYSRSGEMTNVITFVIGNFATRRLHSVTGARECAIPRLRGVMTEPGMVRASSKED
jgi:hypothetical protein